MARLRDCLIEEKARHGTQRFHFHRRPDGRRITIAGEPGQAGFERRYNWLLSGRDAIEERKAASVERIRGGLAPQTFAELYHAYAVHLDKKQSLREIASSTRKHYSRLLQQLVDPCGEVHLSVTEERHLVAILDNQTHTKNTFKNFLRAVKLIFAYAKKYHGLSPNPAVLLEKKTIITDGFREWDDTDLEQFFAAHPMGTKAYLAMMLLMHVAPRRSDLVNLGPANIIERGGKQLVWFKPQKTTQLSNVDVIVPLHPELVLPSRAPRSGRTRSWSPSSANHSHPTVSGTRWPSGVTPPVSPAGSHVVGWARPSASISLRTKRLHIRSWRPWDTRPQGHRSLHEGCEPSETGYSGGVEIHAVGGEEEVSRGGERLPPTHHLTHLTKWAKLVFDFNMIGDPGWIRTIDLPLRRRPLYPLSYGATPRLHARKPLRLQARDWSDPSAAGRDEAPD